MPEAGIEPARYRYRWILSPVRLPVSPLERRNLLYINVIIIQLITNRDFHQRKRQPASLDQYAHQ